MAVVTSCRSIVGSTAWFHTGTCVTGTCIWRGCLHLCLLPFVPWEGVVLHCRKFVQGRYKSIMAVVTSCRSDMSSKGLSPHGHLCDGRLHLVLVHASSRLQYLRFLSSIPQEGMLLTTSSARAAASQWMLTYILDCRTVRKYIPEDISRAGGIPHLVY